MSRELLNEDVARIAFVVWPELDRGPIHALLSRCLDVRVVLEEGATPATVGAEQAIRIKAEARALDNEVVAAEANVAQRRTA
jgi:hypothetical protein